jgi:P27 family predicted phage terminase small subunit
MTTAPRPPAHLSESARTWWRSCVKDYVLEPHHLCLLQLAAEAWDRCQQARATIDREGPTFRDDRGNVRAHPAVAIERDSRIAFARLVRELDLDVEPPANGRFGPPALRSNRRGF